MGRNAGTNGRIDVTNAHASVGTKFLELGMDAATGRADAPDLIAAHKWFNLAALHGNQQAARLRHEIAAEMSAADIAAAQRAARNWTQMTDDRSRRSEG
jgi:TPR repeat protein